MECQYCKHTFSTKANLNNHQKTAKYCIQLRDVSTTSKYKCNGCSKSFSRQYHLDRHTNTCSNNTIFELEKKYKEREEIYEKQIKEQKNQIQELQNKLENIAVKAINKYTYEEPTIDIFEEDIDQNDTKENEEYKLLPLTVGENYVIENREEDNYVNVTNLCKAGDKKFNDWKRIDRTKVFLKTLSMQTGIPASALISIEQTSSTDKATWVHPQVAINIAQWISPEFDVKVSAWIYEVMMTGKVDITNTKSYRQLQQENKDKQIKINYLTRKYVKRISRTQFEEKYVMYILTTERLKKDNIYILGKASNLTSRLSTYNKTDEHEVIYYEQCSSEENMAVVENMVFSKLKEYREVANRERFILPETEKIDKFIFAIKECIRFLQ
jgi:hypothetical protein